MSGILLTSLLITIVVGSITVSVLKSRKIKQVERLDGPKTHLSKMGTPTMGGIMCVITIALMGLVYSVFNIHGVRENLALFLTLIIGSISVGAIGFVDDFLKVEKKNTKGLSPSKKMIGLLLASFAIMYTLVYVVKIGSAVRLVHGYNLELARSIKVILGMLVIISTANAVNLTDGVDGLASSIGIIIMSFLAGVAFKLGMVILGLFLSITIGAYIGFLLFNWNKAKVFMGDTGSFLLGAIIAIAAIVLNLELFLVLIAIVPVFEAISVIIQVLYFKKTKKRFFKMAPIHHHFEAKGWSELKVVVIFTLITIITCLITQYII